MPPIDQERLKTNPMRILDSKDEKTKEINLGRNLMLSAIFPLLANATSRKCLECLDQMEIPYQIDKMLVRGLSYYTHTVFEIMETDEEGRTMTIAGGGRYDYLGKEPG